MLNSGALNAKPLGASGKAVFFDWSALLPEERITVYLLDVGGVYVPISSLQSTLRKAGKSFLQAVIPNGTEYLDVLIPGVTLKVMMGYRFADGTLSSLEEVTQAPLQILRYDEGSFSNSVTVSGYQTIYPSASIKRELRNVSYRSLNQGRRRVRCSVDLFLRAGHEAMDEGVTFNVESIQYFISDRTEYMEVIESG